MSNHPVRPSLESLIEQEDLGLEVLHPGGLEITRELAELCRLKAGDNILDVASGSGESACYLKREFGCYVVGIDISDSMLRKAREKARRKGVDITFVKGDAQKLPFVGERFDAVISECTTCLLDKERAIGEMVRVAKHGGAVGIRDVCWKESAPDQLKSVLKDVEGETPETLAGWASLFECAGLQDVRSIDKSQLIPAWMKGFQRDLGLVGMARIAIRVLQLGGVRGAWRVWKSERVFESEYIGYGIIVGTKP
jgi:SAM-dependent methyltransferase